jgi:hypothetical protein
VLRKLQRETDCVLEIHAFFEQLPEEELDDYFVPDGHCTDRGYDIVAQSVARGLRSMELLRRQP